MFAEAIQGTIFTKTLRQELAVRNILHLVQGSIFWINLTAVHEVC